MVFIIVSSYKSEDIGKIFKEKKIKNTFIGNSLGGIGWYDNAEPYEISLKDFKKLNFKKDTRLKNKTATVGDIKLKHEFGFIDNIKVAKVSLLLPNLQTILKNKLPPEILAMIQKQMFAKETSLVQKIENLSKIPFITEIAKRRIMIKFQNYTDLSDEEIEEDYPNIYVDTETSIDAPSNIVSEYKRGAYDDEIAEIYDDLYVNDLDDAVIKWAETQVDEDDEDEEDKIDQIREDFSGQYINNRYIDSKIKSEEDLYLLNDEEEEFIEDYPSTPSTPSTPLSEIASPSSEASQVLRNYNTPAEIIYANLTNQELLTPILEDAPAPEPQRIQIEQVAQPARPQKATVKTAKQLMSYARRRKQRPPVNVIYPE